MQNLVTLCLGWQPLPLLLPLWRRAGSSCGLAHSNCPLCHQQQPLQRPQLRPALLRWRWHQHRGSSLVLLVLRWRQARCWPCRGCGNLWRREAWGVVSGSLGPLGQLQRVLQRRLVRRRQWRRRAVASSTGVHRGLLLFLARHCWGLPGQCTAFCCSLETLEQSLGETFGQLDSTCMVCLS